MHAYTALCQSFWIDPESALLLPDYEPLSKGFINATFQVSNRDSNALIGTAEAHAQLGKLAAASGNTSVATTHWARSADAYATALSVPTALGSLEDRINARYNCACACALSGRYEEAYQLLSALLASGGTSQEDILRDPDLECVQRHAAFANLMLPSIFNAIR